MGSKAREGLRGATYHLWREAKGKEGRQAGQLGSLSPQTELTLFVTSFFQLRNTEKALVSEKSVRFFCPVEDGPDRL